MCYLGGSCLNFYLEFWCLKYSSLQLYIKPVYQFAVSYQILLVHENLLILMGTTIPDTILVPTHPKLYLLDLSTVGLNQIY